MFGVRHRRMRQDLYRQGITLPEGNWKQIWESQEAVSRQGVAPYRFMEYEQRKFRS